MLRLTLSQNEIEALQRAKSLDLHSVVKKKIDVILLKNEGIGHNTIGRLMGLCKNTVRKYIREYLSGGLEKLKELHYYKQRSQLEDYSDLLKAHFEVHPPRSAQDANDAIVQLTGIIRKPTQIRAFLKKLGLTYQKVGSIPKRADVEEQEVFKKKELDPRLEEAKAGKRTVFFVDAAHFVFAPFLGYLWSFVRLFVEAPAGRQRFSVLAAINAVTLDIVKWTTEKSVNSESLKELLLQIFNLNLKTPITLVLDNARYQHCACIKAYAESLHIELLFLPPYSPNLNLIERLWKFVKRTCLYTKTYDSFATFCTAIETTVTQAPTVHREKLKSLMTLNFQSFAEIKSSGRIIRI